MERDDVDDGLPDSEISRVRRRERERSARDRELMRTGQAKAFKQILDAQARRAAEIERANEGRVGKRRHVEPGPADDSADRGRPTR